MLAGSEVTAHGGGFGNPAAPPAHEVLTKHQLCRRATFRQTVPAVYRATIWARTEAK
jgi:hypothetical protein